jgi:hypothetical protein
VLFYHEVYTFWHQGYWKGVAAFLFYKPVTEAFAVCSDSLHCSRLNKGYEFCCNLSLFGFFSIAQHCAVHVPGTPHLYGLKNFNSVVQAISFQVAYTRLHFGL